MRETKSKSINGHNWEVTPYPGMYGLKIQARLVPFLSGISGIVQGALKSKNIMEADLDIEGLVKAIVENITVETTPPLIRDILFGTRVEGKDVYSENVFNDVFSANYGELYQGLFFVLSVNFGELFQMAGASTDGLTLAEKAENRSKE